MHSHRSFDRASLLAAASALTLLVPAAPAMAAPIRTLLIGDSITFGIVSEPTGPSYAELLAADLTGTHDLVNVAGSGTSAFYWAPGTPCPGICENTDNVFDEFAAPELPANLATLLLGTNDALGFFLDQPTPTDDYESFLREIIDGLFGGGMDYVVLMAAPHSNPPNPTVDDLLAGYRDRVAMICTDTAGVVCGPDLFDLLDPATDFEVDDIHPNALGHQKIATALANTIRSIPEPGTFLLVALGLIGMRIRSSTPLQRR